MVRTWAWVLGGCLMLPLAGCGGGDKVETKPVTAESTPAPATTNTPDTPDKPAVAATPTATEFSSFALHTPGDVALVMARPGRALVNPIVTGLIKEVEAADPSVKFEEQLKSFQDDLGLDPKQIDYVVMSVSSKTLEAMAPQPGPPGFGPPDGFGPPPEAKDIPLEAAPPTDAPTESPEAATEKPTEVPCGDEPTSEGSVVPETTTDEPLMSEDFGGFEPPPSPAVLVHLAAPIDTDKLLADMVAKNKAMVEKFGAPDPAQYEGMPADMVERFKKQDAQQYQRMLKEATMTRSEHGGVTLHQKGDSKDRICFPNSQTILYGQEAVIKAAIDRKGSAAESPLSAQLQSLQDRDFAVAIDISPLNKLMQSGQLELPFPVMLFAAPVLKCKFLALAADIQGGNLLQVNLTAADEAGAKQLHAMLNPLLLDGIKKAKEAKDGPGLPPEASPFLPLGEQILDGTSLTQTGDALSLVVARPAALVDLPTLARPALAEAAQKAAAAKKRNDLKQIGLGMHNFESTFTNLPSHNQGSTENTGLSWRVHLLPYLDEAPLYSEFHMDEPWDSEHNKTLIARMPKLYGSDPEWKSSIHVFVGEGTPLGGKPLKFSDVTDGTSNTILVVRAGEDTADIWTKPGGLPFDKENPIAALGAIGEMFDVLMMDGSARSLPKSIDAATLRDLIQHNDGNPVEIPE